MSLPAKELQIALHEYQEWGEKLRAPRDVRIAKLLSHRSEEEISEIMRICKAVEDMSWKIATEVRDEGLEKDEAIKKIQSEFQFMSAENVSRTYSQAMYYTLK
jgi:hypothetical protein